MPIHTPRRTSLFQRSKTLPTNSYRRFTSPVIPTFRYDDGDTVSYDGDDSSNLPTVPNPEEKPVPVPSQSPSQRITRLWTQFSLTHCLKFICSCSFTYVMFLRSKVSRLEAENIILLTRCNSSSDNNEMEETNSRAVVFFSVIITFVLPFLLYMYLDDLSHVKNLLRRTNQKKEDVPLKKRLAYSLDVCFSVYPYAKLLALLLATVVLIVYGGLALYAVSDCGVDEALWLSWTFVADSGSHADRVGVGARIVSVAISAGGMLIFATMLGLISDAISKMVDSLRKGKSEVLESNHILILGWSDKLGSLLKQLAIANKSIGGGVVVVLAERDKEEMETDIAKFEFDLMGTSVICRSGSPLILADLKKVKFLKL